MHWFTKSINQVSLFYTHTFVPVKFTNQLISAMDVMLLSILQHCGIKSILILSQTYDGAGGSENYSYACPSSFVLCLLKQME